jgi:thiol-disulfide isomerase/thioredoxin
LPWEKNYAAALAKAKAEKRPVFLMLTAEWCGPCKWFEKNTLPTPLMRDGMKEFVWVQAFEDEALNKQFGVAGYPTLVFLNPADERVLEKSSGAEPANSFLKHVMKAREGAGLPLSAEMKRLEATRFEPNWKEFETILEKGDLAAATKFMEPARKDETRTGNFFLLKVNVPAGMSVGDAMVSGGDHDFYQLSKGGLAMRQLAMDQTNVALQIWAPGCVGASESVDLKPNDVIVARAVTLARLDPAKAPVFSGRVLWEDGRPAANAIVRVCDWGVVRADDKGAFKIMGMSPGKFQVRAEAPGGEFHGEVKVENTKEFKKDLTLEPVTTVGVRWAVQTREGEKALEGSGVKTGEAYFSIGHGRFDLERGAEVRQYWGSDFMIDKWNREKFAKYAAKYAADADAAPAGTPVFWLFDACDRQTGLHLETRPFDEIKSVNPDGNGKDRYFEFLRGKPVKKGDVFTVWRVQKDSYAKMEITDVTVVPEKKRGEK